MFDRNLRELTARAFLGVLLLAILGWMLVGYHSVPSQVAQYSTEDAFGPTPEEYVGERVNVGGYAVETDPLTLDVSYGASGRLTVIVEGYDESVSEGDYVRTLGTLEDESTVEALQSTSRTPAESAYMYGISVVGCLWVAVRFSRGWRFDVGQLAFVPRGRRSVRLESPREPRARSSNGTDGRGGEDGG